MWNLPFFGLVGEVCCWESGLGHGDRWLMSFLSKGWQLNLVSQSHPGWKGPQEVSSAARCPWIPAPNRQAQLPWPLFARPVLPVLQPWWSLWPTAQLTPFYLEQQYMRELHITYIKHKALQCYAQSGLCRVSKPLIYLVESGAAEGVFLRWCLHLPTAILTTQAHSSIKSFPERRACPLHAITVEGVCCWHLKKKLTQHCQCCN